MLEVIDGLPDNVLGIEATGTVTQEDYRDVLVPKAEEMMAQGPIRMLFVANEGFDGYSIGAMWNDATFGVQHWRDFERAAVVTDNAYLRGAVTMFAPFFPCEINLFSLSDRAIAEDWVKAERAA